MTAEEIHLIMPYSPCLLSRCCHVQYIHNIPPRDDTSKSGSRAVSNNTNAKYAQVTGGHVRFPLAQFFSNLNNK